MDMRVLVADDNPIMASLLKEYVEQCNHEVVEVVQSGGIDVVEVYERVHPDVVLMDFLMPKLNGAVACKAILRRDPDAKIILISGKVNEGSIFMRDSGATAVMAKPIVLGNLATLLTKLAYELNRQQIAHN